jgi:two-component system, NtrC family, sensor kinase
MGNLADLSHCIEPLAPEHKIADIGDLFLDEKYNRFLSLPVVVEEKPVGIISRATMQRLLTVRYGRELQGNKPVERFMNPQPLLVSTDQTMEDASRFITRNISFPITEDFILTKDGRYHGVGSVIDLLHSMEERLVVQNQSLARAFQQLKSSQAQLVQSEKMASLGQMVAGVAHEINTPLGYVKNNLDMIGQSYKLLGNLEDACQELMEGLMHGQLPDEVLLAKLQGIDDIRNECRNAFPREDMQALFHDTEYGLGQISEIVLNLKNFSRLDQAPIDNVDINQCIDSALLIARNVIKHKAEVVKKYGELPKLPCSPSQINQVMLNLLTNAAHAIECPDGLITIRTKAEAGYIHVIVTDNGKGIAEPHLAKIFDPFFTTKPVGEGTGLGLSIAFRIVRDHGGTIRVKSIVGQGSAFCVSLPIVKAAPSSSEVLQ